RLLRPERGDPRTIYSWLRPGHRRDPAPGNLVGLDPARPVRRVLEEPHRVRAPVHLARHHPRHRLGRGDHAPHTGDAPRGAAAGLRPHGVGEGPPRARGRAQARPEERRDPRRHRSRPAGRARRPRGASGAVSSLVLLVMAVFADRIAPYAYDESIAAARMLPPSWRFWMGTDNLARDIWSRVVFGARISITVGFATVALATL